MTYDEFIESKRHTPNKYGFEPLLIPQELFDFQLKDSYFKQSVKNCELAETQEDKSEQLSLT
jgi:hypothetical protein